MKKTYKLLCILIAIELMIISIMNEKKIIIQSWIGNAIGLALFLMPILILLNLISKDKKITIKYRWISKGIFWFLVICYIAGAIGKMFVF